MPKAARVEIKLSVAVRLQRVRSLVEALPEGDQDRDDLLAVFDELARLERSNARLRTGTRGARICRKENRQLRGALSLARYALKMATQRITEMDTTISWLRRRVRGRKDLQSYEIEELQRLAREHESG